ncbi:MAG: D-glycerate dehydrogenase [Phycisphaerales bacterium]|nr:D-glycerate dehydrogenase [Phycisphaerales bacterium]
MPIHVLLNCVGDPIPMLVRAGIAAEEVVVTPNATQLSASDLHRLIHGATAILAPLTIKIDGDLLDAAGNDLKVVANYAVGVDNIDLEACSARGVSVCNGPPPMVEPTADIAWALVLATARRLREGIAIAESGSWRGYEPDLLLGHRLTGGTLLVVGAGRVGAAVARRSIGWGMTVHYTARSEKPHLHEPPIAASRVTLEEGLPIADAVVLTTSLNASTRHLMNERTIGMMKPEAVLVNVSRGPVVDEAALAAALRDGRIHGAGLDVFEQEPRIHPDLLAAPNVVVLPHIGSATVEDRTDLTRISVENVLAVLAGEEPAFPVRTEPTP